MHFELQILGVLSHWRSISKPEFRLKTVIWLTLQLSEIQEWWNHHLLGTCFSVFVRKFFLICLLVSSRKNCDPCYIWHYLRHSSITMLIFSFQINHFQFHPLFYINQAIKDFLYSLVTVLQTPFIGRKGRWSGYAENAGVQSWSCFSALVLSDTKLDTIHESRAQRAKSWVR